MQQGLRVVDLGIPIQQSDASLSMQHCYSRKGLVVAAINAWGLPRHRGLLLGHLALCFLHAQSVVLAGFRWQKASYGIKPPWDITESASPVPG